MNATWSLVSSISPIGSLILKVLLVTGPMNFNKALRNTLSEQEFPMLGSSLFYSVRTKKKKGFLN